MGLRRSDVTLTRGSIIGQSWDLVIHPPRHGIKNIALDAYYPCNIISIDAQSSKGESLAAPSDFRNLSWRKININNTLEPH